MKFFPSSTKIPVDGSRFATLNNNGSHLSFQGLHCKSDANKQALMNVLTMLYYLTDHYVTLSDAIWQHKYREDIRGDEFLNEFPLTSKRKFIKTKHCSQHILFWTVTVTSLIKNYKSMYVMLFCKMEVQFISVLLPLVATLKIFKRAIYYKGKLQVRK